jgi:hypothetical protein
MVSSLIAFAVTQLLVQGTDLSGASDGGVGSDPSDDGVGSDPDDDGMGSDLDDDECEWTSFENLLTSERRRKYVWGKSQASV